MSVSYSKDYEVILTKVDTYVHTFFLLKAEYFFINLEF